MLVVDQYMETGATVNAAIRLVENAGGIVTGVTMIGMERSNPTAYQDLTSRYKCHDIIPEHMRTLFDSHEFRAKDHSHLLLKKN